MPGRLVMDVKQPQGPAGLKRDGSHLSEPPGSPEAKRLAMSADVAHNKTNGTDHHVAGNGPTASGLIVTNGVHPDGDDVVANRSAALSSATAQDSPPELEKYSDSLVPFGKLLERMAQQTYFDLSELVDALADMRVQQQPHMANGMVTQPPPDKSPVSVDKKLRLLNFAQTHKDRFIKGLVLADWARNMGDMNKLIDVSMFLRKQDWATHSAADSIYRLKEQMTGAKMPNPNIEGALELLATGEAPWMPDLGYVPPKPLTAQEMLATLTDMNFALSVRLNLHEELPAQFENFSIANGRVTFRVDGEFEVDLAIAEEAPESPFYFIDLRLQFSPAGALTNDRLRNQLEAQVNDALVVSGLKGCYDFLHNFVITHKINILRCQALDLARSKWLGHIDVQSVNRSLVIQYWKGLQGSKNWIEIGIIKHSRTSSASASAASPGIACRWFRRGQEIHNHELDFDYTRLSVESMLERVVARHISGRLSSIHDYVRESQDDSSKSSSVSQELTTSQAEPSDCSLSLRLRPMSRAITLGVEPVSGTYYISPQSPESLLAQSRLDSTSGVDSFATVRHHICRTLLSQIDDQAASGGLSRTRTEARKNTDGLFARKPVVYHTFERNASPPVEPSAERYGITAAVDLSEGLSWYLTRIVQDKEASIIKTLDLIRLPDSHSRPTGPLSILEVEQRAVTRASMLTLLQELRSAKIAFDWNGGAKTGSLEGQVIVKTDSIWTARDDRGRGIDVPPIYSELSTLTHGSRDRRDNENGATLCLRARLIRPTSLPLVQQLRRSFNKSGFVRMSSRRLLRITLRAKVGQRLLPLLQKALRDTARSVSFVEVLASTHFTVLRASPIQLTFLYAPLLICNITKFDDAARELSFKWIGPQESPQENPHNRIQKQLQSVLSQLSTYGNDSLREVHQFATFCQLLRATLPVLKVSESLESREPVGSVILHCHRETLFRLSYRTVLAGSSFDVIAKERQGRFFWSLRVHEMAKNVSDETRQQLGLLLRSKGEHWTGLRVGAVATPEGIEDLLSRLDTIMRSRHAPPASAATREQPSATATRAPKQDVVVLD